MIYLCIIYLYINMIYVYIYGIPPPDLHGV